MNDDMIDLAAGDVRLRRRLEAYAELRLSPDLTASSRMRARVLAQAHRRADLVRADAALTIVPDTAAVSHRGRRMRSGRRAAVALVAAALFLGAMVGGAAAASGPGGALYEARLWVEAVTLPAHPSARAIAELERLADRLREADEAALRGDQAAVAAALAAYERIVAEASAAAVDAGDPVAAAALEAGIGRNVDVLQALIARLSGRPGEAIGAALERAIERSNGAIDTVGAVDRPTPDGGTGGKDAAGEGQGDDRGGSNGGSGGSGAGTNAGGQEATPKPTKAAPQPPAATGKPSTTDRPDQTPKPTPDPTRPPKANDQPPGGPPPGDRQD